MYLGGLKYKIYCTFIWYLLLRVSRQLAPNTRVIKIDNRRLSYLVLDLGCGCGAQGIAAIKCGAKTPVTFNDIDPDALEAVTLNNQANYINSSSNSTGKSFSEALIIASTNPQYDKRLFIDLPVQYMKTIIPQNVVYINCFGCQNKTKKKQFFYTTCKY